MAGRTKFHLNEDQYEELLLAEKMVDKPKLLKKLQCIKLKDKGWKHEKVADFLEVSIQTISTRVNIYIEGGIEKLLSRNYAGKVTIFTSKMLEEIRQKNREKPFDTAKEAKAYIQEKYGLDFHLHYIQKLVKKNFIFRTKSKK